MTLSVNCNEVMSTAKLTLLSVFVIVKGMKTIQEERRLTDEQFETYMQAILDGDKDGLHCIYKAYGAYIFSIVYDILKNREDAEDVTTEFFIKLWKVADKYQFGGAHRAWLGRIAHNMAIDYIRAKKQHESYEEVIETKEIGQETFEEQSVNKMALKEAVETLETEEQEIVNMKVLGQLTFKEIAGILQKPMGTITWKYRQAMEKLRRCQL